MGDWFDLQHAHLRVGDVIELDFAPKGLGIIIGIDRQGQSDEFLAHIVYPNGERWDAWCTPNRLLYHARYQIISRLERDQ